MLAYTEMKAECERLSVEIERLNTWDGLMSLLDKWYPAEVFNDANSMRDDPGPRIIVLIREVDRLSRALAAREERR